MKKGLVISFVTIGSILLIAGGVLLGFGIKETVNNNKEIIKTYTFEENYESFNFILSTTNITFKVSEDDTQKVVVYEHEKNYHEVGLMKTEGKENYLLIHEVDNRDWYEKWFYTPSLKVEIYIPLGEYKDLNSSNATGNMDIPNGFIFDKVNITNKTGNLKFASEVNNETSIVTSTGSITLDGARTNTLVLNSSTGSINVKETTVDEKLDAISSTGSINVSTSTAKNASLEASTGSVRLSNTMIEEHLSVKTSTGSISLTDSDAATLKLKASTGSIRGILLSPHIFYAMSKTGSVHVPTSTEGGICEVETSTGSISFSIKE